MSSLLLPLLQLVKTGFTKAAQRLDGIFALFCVVKIAAVDVKAGAYFSSFRSVHSSLQILFGCIICS